jgi:hypothetical protein
LAHFVGSLLAVFSASRQDRNCALSKSAYKGAAYQNLTFTIEMGVYHVEKLIRISRLLESVKDIYKLNSVTRRDLSAGEGDACFLEAWVRGHQSSGAGTDYALSATSGPVKPRRLARSKTL